MDRRIRLLGVVLIGCFALLFLQLNNFQVRAATSLQQSPFEPNVTPNAFEEPRGEIVSSDGVVLAMSTPVNDSYKEQRSYPEGSLFADVTGYYDVVDQASTGIENEYDTDLEVHQSTANNLQGLLTEKSGADTVALTISARLQAVARNALHGENGAVVAIDPRTGAVLALYANPTFDPNLFAAHSRAAVEAAYAKLYTDYAKAGNASHSPLINGATQQTDPPGSTFKVVTTAAMYDHDTALINETVPTLSALNIPGTNLPLHNFGGESCGGALPQILAFSCDTAYAKIGLELGAENLVAEANAFGFNKVPPLDLPSGEVAASTFPSAEELLSNTPFVAYSAIGQGNVQETALEDAMIAAAIGNNGVIMAPHLLSNVVNNEGAVVSSYAKHPWIQATSSATANAVRHLMLGVTQIPGGTGYGLGLQAYNIAAKTGTAETGTSDCTANWFIATGPAGQGQTPSIAVAAVVPYTSGQSTCDATGATVAGPVAKAVILAGLALSK